MLDVAIVEMFDFFHNKLLKIPHNIKWKYLFQWLNIYSVQRSSKHPVYYSIYIYCGTRNETERFTVM